MYTDYDVKYVSNINEFLIPMLIFIGILIVIAIIYFISLAKVFKKANRSGIAAIIPIYNILIMLEIVNMPSWYIILFFVPIVNIVLSLVLFYKIARSFRKTSTFSLLTMLFPFIFIPIIAFSDSEYIGINKEAMLGMSYASDKPIVKEEEMEAAKPDDVQESKPLDISIGGGVYQKDYQETLLDVPEEVKNTEMLASFKVEQEPPQAIMPEPEKTGAALLKNVEFIEAAEIHPSNFDMPVQSEPPRTITTDEFFDSIPEINVNAAEDVDIMSIEPVPTIIGPQEITENILIPNMEEAQPEPQFIEPITSKQPAPNNTISSNQVSGLNNLDYATCSNCGATIKKDAPRCFMCGKER